MAILDLKRSFQGAQLRPLTAIRHLRTMFGTTQAHLLRASDGQLYVTKFQNNPGHSRVLASEFLATRLGLWLGLPMSRVAVINVPEWLVNDALLRIETEERLIRCASGRQLAFRYFPDAINSLPQDAFMKVTNRLDLIRVLAFDKWVSNCDNRQAIFLPHGKDKYRVKFIDQHQCFNADRWTFPDLPHHGSYEYKSVYRQATDWLWFEPTLSLVEKISRFDLWKFATEIPPEWYAHDTDALSRLVERLYRRRSIVRDLITAFRNSKRHPFPGWK